MPDSRLKYYGALLECFVTYPLFAEDFDLLVEKEYLKQEAPDKCKWLKSKTSLAQYFKWIGDGVTGTTGGKWQPIAKAFGEDKRQLERLSEKERPPSKDLIKLLEIIPPYRDKLNQKRNDKKAFNAIKTLINNVDENKSDEIHVNIKKIQKIIEKFVGKN